MNHIKPLTLTAFIAAAIILLALNNFNLRQKLQAYQNPNGISRHGQLKVDNGKLIDQNGDPAQLRGISSHGIQWYPQYGNHRSILTLRDAGANLFRIAMYTTENGYDKDPEKSKTTLRMALENSLGADMYTIVDWHVLKDESLTTYLDESLEFFDEISSLYADEPGVIYEICNEPNGDTTWDDIKAYAEQVIPVIRKNSPAAVIIVGTPNFSTSIDEAAADPLGFENIMYAFHFYADYSQGGYEWHFENAREQNIGIFVSEWGIGSEYDEDLYSELITKCGAFIDYLDSNGISWASWALSNKDEGHSILKPDTKSWSKWDQNELTDYGKFVFNRLGESS